MVNNIKNAFQSHFEMKKTIQKEFIDGSGVKAMPGSIPTPSSGSLKKNKKIQVAKWGTPKKY